MGERWRPVPACRWFGIPAGRFEVTAEGCVRSAARVMADGRRTGPVVLAQVPDKDGYLRVRFGRRWLAVHVLVVLAFKGPPEVRHLGERTDNRPAKLAWGSKWENEQDKKEEQNRSGTVLPAAETHGTAGHL